MCPRTSNQCHDGPVNGVTSVETGGTFISGGSDGAVYRHRLGAEPEYVTDVGAAISTIESLPDTDGLLVGCEDGRLVAVSLNNGEIAPCPIFHTGPVSAIVGVPDSDGVLTTSYDGTIGLWDTRHWKLQHKLVDDALTPIASAAVDPAGDWFATSGVDAGVSVWEMDTLSTARTLGEESDTSVAMATTPDSQYLLGLNYEGEVELWETDLWGAERSFQTNHSGEGSLAVHPHGTYVAVCEPEGVTVYTLEGEIVTHFETRPSRAGSLHYSGDGTMLGVGCEDGRVVSLDIDL